MPTATVASASPHRFSLPRSAAIATALALHLAIALMLAMPIAAPERDTPEPTVIRTEVLPPPPPPPIAPPPPARVVRITTPMRPLQPPLPVTPRVLPEPTTAPTAEASDPLDAIASQGIGDVHEPATPSDGAGLVLRRGTPPRYPHAAMSRRLEGEVTLLILVGVDGRPEAVTVVRSSGHAVLDRAAREHVLRDWVFEPALRHGIAVPAHARVPVRFSLP